MLPYECARCCVGSENKISHHFIIIVYANKIEKDSNWIKWYVHTFVSVAVLVFCFLFWYSFGRKSVFFRIQWNLTTALCNTVTKVAHHEVLETKVTKLQRRRKKYAQKQLFFFLQRCKSHWFISKQATATCFVPNVKDLQKKRVTTRSSKYSIVIINLLTKSIHGEKERHMHGFCHFALLPFVWCRNFFFSTVVKNHNAHKQSDCNTVSQLCYLCENKLIYIWNRRKKPQKKKWEEKRSHIELK